MKKVTTLFLTLVICALPMTSVFANDTIQEIDFSESPLIVTLDNPDTRNSVSGNGGTAYIGGVSENARNITWRLTSTKGSIIWFKGYITISKGKTIVKTLYVSGGGSSSITRTESLGILGKGTYKATFQGNGQKTSGVFNVLPGCVHHFTKY